MEQLYKFWEFPKIRATILVSPLIIRVNYGILGSILGSPDFGKLPSGDHEETLGFVSVQLKA